MTFLLWLASNKHFWELYFGPSTMLRVSSQNMQAVLSRYITCLISYLSFIHEIPYPGNVLIVISCRRPRFENLVWSRKQQPEWESREAPAQAVCFLHTFFNRASSCFKTLCSGQLLTCSTPAQSSLGNGFHLFSPLSISPNLPNSQHSTFVSLQKSGQGAYHTRLGTRGALQGLACLP